MTLFYGHLGFWDGSPMLLTLYHPSQPSDVLVTVEDDAASWVSISSGSSCFLVESFHGLWNREVEHEADVSFIYAHPKGDGGTHHLEDRKYWEVIIMIKCFYVIIWRKKENKKQTSMKSVCINNPLQNVRQNFCFSVKAKDLISKWYALKIMDLICRE